MPAVEVKYNYQPAPDEYPIAVLRCPHAPSAEWQIWSKFHEGDRDLLSREKCYVVSLPKQPGLSIG